MIAALQLASPGHKLCRHCCEEKPLTEFRRRRTGSEDRHAQCNSCRNRKQREQYALQRAKTNGDLVAKAMRKLKGAATYAEVEYFIGSMIEVFGGVQGFAQATWKCFGVAPPGRKLEFFMAMQRAIELSQPPEPDVDAMSDDELDEVFTKQVSELLTENPHVAADALRVLGWSVEPPATVQ